MKKTKCKVMAVFGTIFTIITGISIMLSFVAKEPKIIKVDNKERLILDYDFSCNLSDEEKDYLNSALLENNNVLTIFVADTKRFDNEVARYYLETFYTDKDIPYVVFHYNYVESRLEYSKSDNVNVRGFKYRQYFDNAHYTQVYEWIPNITSEEMVTVASQDKVYVVFSICCDIFCIILMLVCFSSFIWKSNGVLKYRETFFGTKVKIKINKKCKDVLRIEFSIPNEKINCVVFPYNNDLIYEERIIRVVFKDEDLYYTYSFGCEDLEKIEWAEEEIARTFNDSHYFKYTIHNYYYEEESNNTKEDNQEEEKQS